MFPAPQEKLSGITCASPIAAGKRRDYPGAARLPSVHAFGAKLARNGGVRVFFLVGKCCSAAAKRSPQGAVRLGHPAAHAELPRYA